MNSQTMKKGSMLAVAAVALTVGVAGGSILHTTQSNAQTPTVTKNTQDQAAPQRDFDPSKGGHTANGKTEEILTGDTAEKVRAAALSAVPGGTIQRVETEVDGNGVYEAHMTKSDGTPVTVFFDSNYKVTSTQEGHGGMKAR